MANRAGKHRLPKLRAPCINPVPHTPKDEWNKEGRVPLRLRPQVVPWGWEVSMPLSPSHCPSPFPGRMTGRWGKGGRVRRAQGTPKAIPPLLFRSLRIHPPIHVSYLRGRPPSLRLLPSDRQLCYYNNCCFINQAPREVVEREREKRGKVQKLLQKVPQSTPKFGVFSPENPFLRHPLDDEEMGKLGSSAPDHLGVDGGLSPPSKTHGLT